MLLILFLFFISGALGLIDEIVWVRMLLLSFGSTTYSVVLVLSTFMAGLALGSFILGRMADKKKDLVRFYGKLEFAVGISVLSTLVLIPLVHQIYKLTYFDSENSWWIFILRFLLASGTLLPATFFMGGTLPTLIRFFTLNKKGVGNQTSILYAVNTLGAAVGTVLAGFLLIEIFGLRNSLIFSALINLIIGTILLKRRKIEAVGETEKSWNKRIKMDLGWLKIDRLFIVLLVFGLSGLISMAYEVLWTRILTPSVGTYIYAFSLILALFLIGIAVGSFIVRKFFTKDKELFGWFGFCEVGIGISALATLVATSQFLEVDMIVKVVVVLLPATILMGATFPIVANMFSAEEKIGSTVGKAYAFNTVGSIIGPIIAGFILIPILGTTRSIMVLATFNILLGLIMIYLHQDEDFPKKEAVAAITVLLIFLVFSVIFKGNLFMEKSTYTKIKALKEQNYNLSYMEDESASTLAYSNIDRSDSGLIVDGVPMTARVMETKMMAHLPLFLHPNPNYALVIAFGMGTTFRSAMTHNIRVDAIELIPSVPKAFPIFYADAENILQNPKGKIMINDGRNYVFLTKNRYDVVTLDPPPPLNGANTTVLYSKEFYEQVKRILTDDGIFSQWIFVSGVRKDDFSMMVKSFSDTFPYISIWRAPAKYGIYLLGSKKPVVLNKMEAEKRYKEKKVFEDINEWRPDSRPYTLDELLDLYVGEKDLLKPYTLYSKAITDDHPYIEYFLWRYKFVESPKFYDTDDLFK